MVVDKRGPLARWPLSLADALLCKSGEKGIIITQTQVADRSSEAIRWFPKGEQDDETYFRSAVAAAAAKGQGLKLRLTKSLKLAVKAGRSQPQGQRWLRLPLHSSGT